MKYTWNMVLIAFTSSFVLSFILERFFPSLMNVYFNLVIYTVILYFVGFYFSKQKNKK